MKTYGTGDFAFDRKRRTNDKNLLGKGRFTGLIMGTRQLRGSKYKKRKSEKKRNFSFLLILAAMTAGGIYFSAGSAAKFFIALLIEAICVISFWVLMVFLMNGSGRKRKGAPSKARTVKLSKKEAERTYLKQDTKLSDTYMTRNRATKPIEKKYNWTVENDNPKPAAVNDEKPSEVQSDIKAQVANWSKLVDYSGTVFNRIKEQSYQQTAAEASEIESDGLSEDDETGAAMSGAEEFSQSWDEIMQCEAEEPENGDEEEYAGYDISHKAWKENADPMEDEENYSRINIMFDEQDEDERYDLEYETQEDDDSDLIASEEKPLMYEEMLDDDTDVPDSEAVENPDRSATPYIEERKKLVLKGMHNSKAKLLVKPKIQFDSDELKKPEQTSTNTLKSSNAGEKPPVDLLKASEAISRSAAVDHSPELNARKLIDTLASFGVGAKIINISKGPSVTRYELQPDYGVKVSKIVNLTDDIALNLAATGVRIEAPIPGKAAIGIEIPNKEVNPVFIRDVIESAEFQNHPSRVAFAVGKDIAGNVVVADIAKMPHLLIAGATGSGKSVCINTLITSILYKSSPEEVRLLMVDPKVVELSIYNGIPHLLIPVVTDPKKAAGALNWAVQEMTQRYKLFADNSVRDLRGYNHLMRERGESILPQIVIIIDELADLMMVAANEVEDCICRLAQMARAAGMHLVIATQRPSVDVITGVIKANVPSRISFAVSSQIDSRTILDMAGAEKLLGRGDMLFNPLGISKPVRVQGGLITDKEVESIVAFLKSNHDCQYDEEVLEKIDRNSEATQLDPENDDELLPQVVNMVIEQGQASTSLIQRKFKLGYSRAARIVDQLESNGIVGPFEGSKPRKVLITKQQWMEMN